MKAGQEVVFIGTKGYVQPRAMLPKLNDIVTIFKDDGAGYWELSGYLNGSDGRPQSFPERFLRPLDMQKGYEIAEEIEQLINKELLILN